MEEEVGLGMRYGGLTSPSCCLKALARIFYMAGGSVTVSTQLKCHLLREALLNSESKTATLTLSITSLVLILGIASVTVRYLVVNLFLSLASVCALLFLLTSDIEAYWALSR